ncbi:hypothetical protein Bcav_3198 [Beutenbergia cavernae DSM 12333]|uniref:Uncharacterized protein n=1 Tax=Beutenbergia cavernae (strain ATCC BAA-8 / DSM 12333 / CCUG 43141 / JCM 11478 / NBRC 16432 / NCIMB 13614 / HKI 0122) TaxID=471853 RepID=C5C0P6_BEUC1|nr:hypothetical protein [Beutenbergia cavernae]ACQ81442.1 hypothetical protein Bcav_3198 [Beutenbergia cavernae DSM 12333]
MNDLIEAPADRPGLDEWYKSLKIIGPGVTAATDSADGGFATVNGLAGVVGTAADIAEFVLDPIASMASSVAGFLLDYMPPLPQFLDELAGSPQEVAAKAGTWMNVSERVTQVAQDYRDEVSRALTGWEGPAADSYRPFADAGASFMDQVAALAAGTSGAMTVASGVVAGVRQFVRDLIADLVGKLISWAAQVAATVGVGATWVVPKAVRAIAQWVERCREWITKLTNAISSLCTKVDEINDALAQSIPRIGTILQNLERGASDLVNAANAALQQGNTSAQGANA